MEQLNLTWKSAVRIQVEGKWKETTGKKKTSIHGAYLFNYKIASQKTKN